MMILHSILPHLHHSHQLAEEISAEQIHHHSHDGEYHHHNSEEQSEEDESNFLLTLLLESHSHDTEIDDDSEILVNYNKVVVGKDLPIITLLSQYRVPPDVVLVSEKKNFRYNQDFKQEHLFLNCPLRAPPTLG